MADEDSRGNAHNRDCRLVDIRLVLNGKESMRWTDGRQPVITEIPG